MRRNDGAPIARALAGNAIEADTNKMHLGTTPSKRAEAFRLIARGFDALAEAESETEARPAIVGGSDFYRSETPPAGFSWRSVLEHARRGAFPLVRAGRNVLVRRADFHAWLASRERPAAVRDADAALAGAMGLVLPMRAGARRAAGGDR